MIKNIRFIFFFCINYIYMTEKDTILYKTGGFLSRFMIKSTGWYFLLFYIYLMCALIFIMIYVLSLGLIPGGIFIVLSGTAWFGASTFLTLLPIYIYFYISAFYTYKKIVDNPEKIKKYLNDPKNNGFMKWYIRNFKSLLYLKLFYIPLEATVAIAPVLIDVFILNNLVFAKVNSICK
jgi:hypothetical protein